MEWEDELKKHILKWIKEEFDPEANMNNLCFIDIGLPEDIDFNEFSIPNLGKFYAYSIMKENYEQAEKIKEMLAKKGSNVNLDINEKTREGILEISFVPEKGVEKIEINMKVLKNGLSIDWDKELKDKL
jgi:hypothetical protein